MHGVGGEQKSLGARGLATAVGELEAFEKLVKAKMGESGKDSGQEWGGKFATELRARLEAAMKALPKAELGADASDAERAVADAEKRGRDAAKAETEAAAQIGRAHV